MAYSWSDLEKIYNKCLDLPPSKRVRYIKKESEGNYDLEKKLLDILNYSEESDNYFNSLKGKIAKGFQKEAPSLNLQKGDIISKYEIVSTLGSGGMGKVYLAQRIDGQFEQKVAIKCFSNPTLKEAFWDSFRQEQQFLASLKHANIAHILDGGITEKGIPYIIMEYVEGQPINIFLKENERSTQEKLFLFLEICKTIQFAHNQLILHLDIKPNNILISTDGNIKLLDFGIAKKVGSDAIANDKIMATPYYSAPEQLKQQKPSTATDIYQLGILLHIMIGGEIPFDKTEDMLVKRVMKIKSTYFDPELLAILNTCLHEKPEKRYSSVTELIQDINNYIAGYPVRVFSNAGVYKLQKLIRRNKIVFSLAFLLACALIIGFFISVRQTLIAKEQSQAAKIAAEKSERVSEFLISIFESANPNLTGGENINIEDLLEETTNKIALYSDDEVKAELLFVLGTTYSKTGEYALADSLLSSSIELNKKLGLIESENNFLVYFELSKAKMYGSQLTESLEVVREGINLAQKLIPNNNKIMGLLSMQYALVMMEAGDTKKADSILSKKWFVTQEKNLDPLGLAEAYNTKASIKHYSGDIEASIVNLKKAIAIIKESYSESHPFYLTLNENLSSGYRQIEEFEKALKLQKESIKKTELIYGKEHLNYIKSANSIGLTYRDMDSLDQAYIFLKEAVTFTEKTLGKRTLAYISSAGNLSLTLSKLNRHAEAEAIAHEAFQNALDFVGPKHPFYLWSVGVYADALAKNQKLDEAEQVYRQAINKQIEVMGKNHKWVKKSINGLAQLLNTKGDINEADSIKGLLNNSGY